jgi:glycosyltransferase involved in cell wall biosynthesis
MKLDDPSSGFRVKGWADDVREVLARYRVNLAPLRFGAGIKGKVADGWVVGTPCVGTSIAAEGMTYNGSFGGVVEDNWDSFAHAAVSLYDDHQKWQAAQTRGVDILRSRFAADACEDTLSERLTLALGSLSQRRGANFVGTMLWYHAHRSTEYFARWIECKERRGSS